ncbi:hypothetical protein KL918_004390 [Ogataea parapolymorpha]|uniref:Uncharacterized protein n=1 Tax=Ogataea parapolymorpha (strain ATCC 26012 / BCRC 20466 / JCM 22074 / NRRL Y-7560 / DL-1) TaxID=871575 RepID=W1QFB7_OGAPD|nr:hypothetical protein HPODL_00188 [Ogataea parapolymorpha DL-1]ESX00773.1 hypothetical protein HPODL_00188 [Ogataea parapolymorpha DL-1]KAG7865509.1 hypothetical protein KL918_004390 [Ogataea parapolymorpha]KAG7873617.1 hypothetical protein KL916_002221 [Ogataea parapolymorpha]
MVTKLTFKGEKRGKPRPDDERKRRKKDTKTENQETRVTLTSVNGLPTNIYDIPRDYLEYGWTLATSHKDLDGPIMICFDRSGHVGCLEFDKKDGLIAAEEKKVDIAEDALNFIDFEPKSPLYKLEPQEVTQVLSLVNIDNFLKLTQQAGDVPDNILKYALKNNEGKYLSYDVDTNTLTQTDVLTENAIFNLRANNDGLGFFISVGNVDSKNKLIVTQDLKFRIIQDTDDLLDDLNLYHIRIQTKHSDTGRKILASLDLKNGNRDQLFDDPKQNELLNRAAKELANNGMKITNSLLSQIKRAVEEGNLNEFLITVKEKIKSDRRA